MIREHRLEPVCVGGGFRNADALTSANSQASAVTAAQALKPLVIDNMPFTDQ